MPKGVFKVLTKDDEEIIKRDYLKKPIKRLAAELGTTGGTIQRRLKKWGLEIPKEIIVQRKRASQFNKDHKPFNKGKKQKEYLSKKSIERISKTYFKKGHEPHNTKKSDGEVSIRVDTKTKISYKYIRVKKGDWELLSRYTYREFIGPLKRTDVIRFKDGNQLNCSLDNLEKITREENINRNFHNLPAELKTAIKTKSRILKLIENGKQSRRA